MQAEKAARLVPLAHPLLTQCSSKVRLSDEWKAHNGNSGNGSTTHFKIGPARLPSNPSLRNEYA
jgi:hypothetical protein